MEARSQETSALKRVMSSFYVGKWMRIGIMGKSMEFAEFSLSILFRGSFSWNNEDDIAFSDTNKRITNDILKVIRRVDENWVEGKLGDKVGIFPISFVEV
eukprot:g35242.t1